MDSVLLDTSALVSLIDTNQYYHKTCHKILKSVTGKLITTSAVLTETFHFIDIGSPSWKDAVEFVKAYVNVDVDKTSNHLSECFDLMIMYKDNPMDFADASLVVTAGNLGTLNVFTLDVNDFSSYKVRRGLAWKPFNILGLDLLKRVKI